MAEDTEITHEYSDKEMLFAVPADAKGYQIKHKDFFNFKNLYIYMHEWLVNEEWVKASDADFPETFHLQHERQQSGHEIWIWWRIPKPINQYYKWQIDIDFHIILLKPTDVIHNGVKYKSNTGEVEIKIWAYLEADWQRKWRKHWLLKSIHPLFVKRIFKHNLDAHKRELYRETMRFTEAIKTFLKLGTYLKFFNTISDANLISQGI